MTTQKWYLLSGGILLAAATVWVGSRVGATAAEKHERA